MRELGCALLLAFAFAVHASGCVFDVRDAPGDAAARTS